MSLIVFEVPEKKERKIFEFNNLLCPYTFLNFQVIPHFSLDVYTLSSIYIYLFYLSYEEKVQHSQFLEWLKIWAQ